MLSRYTDKLLLLVDRWVRRNTSPETAPILLDRRRIYVLPTRAGLVFAIALAVMLLTALNYNLNLGFGTVFLLLTAAFVSIFHAFRNLLRLSISPGRASPVFAGEKAIYHLSIENARRSLRPALRLKTPDSEQVFNLAAHSVTDIAVTRATTRRGWLPLGRLVLETHYPLGLIRAWSVLLPESTCLVYPTPEKDPPPLPDSQDGSRGTHPGGTGEEDYAGLRNAQPADPPRHIAWKIIAREGPMMTKQFTGVAGGELVLDWSASIPAPLDAEARISRLTAWVLQADANSRRFRLNLPGIQGAMGSGAAHVHTCLRQLALYGGKRDD